MVASIKDLAFWKECGFFYKLMSENINAAYYSIRALGAIGPAAKDAIPLLVNYLGRENISYYAADALEKIGVTSKEGIESLKKVILTKHYYDQYSAANTLDSIILDSEEVRVNDK